MSVPLCHRTLRPVDSGAFDKDDRPIYVTQGSACVGSRCAAWHALYLSPKTGRCGLMPMANYFQDPAKPEPEEPKS